LNFGRMTSTNLVHQIAFRVGARGWRKAYVAALYSSPSLLAFEMEGRSYGGGVLKVETREAERVLVPRLDVALAAALSRALPRLDDLVRQARFDDANAVADDVIALHGLMPASDLAAMRQGHQELRAQRLARGRSRA